MPNTLGKLSGRSSCKVLGISSKSSSYKTSSSAKVATSEEDSSSDTDDTAEVFMACIAPSEEIEHVYKTKAKLCWSNLKYGWLIDSGMLQTMCLHQGWFTHFTLLSKHTKVILSDDSSIPAMGTGCVKVHMFTKEKWIKSILQDVLYILDLYGNLLSVSHLAWHGAKVCFLRENCHMYDWHKL